MCIRDRAPELLATWQSLELRKCDGVKSSHRETPCNIGTTGRKDPCLEFRGCVSREGDGAQASLVMRCEQPNGSLGKHARFTGARASKDSAVADGGNRTFLVRIQVHLYSESGYRRFRFRWGYGNGRGC